MEDGDRRMTFEEWVRTVPERVKAEACWRFAAYPKALYVYELAWDDCDALMRDERGRAVARAPADCWDRPSSKRDRLSWTRCLHSWLPRNAATNPAADSILNSIFSILYSIFYGEVRCPSFKV